MDLQSMLNEMAKLFPMFSANLAAGTFIFVRLLGFMRAAPVFSRKDIPGMVKLSLALLLTIAITPLIHADVKIIESSFVLSLLLNYVVGAIIGFIARVILLAVDAGADMINMQMGLSSAMVLDPSTSTQVSIMQNLFSVIGVLIFIEIGGIYWMFNAFVKSIEIFPLGAVTLPLEQIINLDYLVKITSNVLYMGLQVASPILLATLGQDIILGIISKTAPQVNVFQLSFLFKPVLGAAILIWIMPMIINVINQYFLSFANII